MHVCIEKKKEMKKERERERDNEPQQRPFPAEKDDAWMYYNEQETIDINKYTEIRTK